MKKHLGLIGWSILVTGLSFIPPANLAAQEKPKLKIVDTHTHFYDPTRPQGVPWPGKNDKKLYRPVLPDEYKKFAKPFGVVGTIVVEASPWVEDNQWLLDLAAKEPFLVGVIGRLDPAADDFEKNLRRFARNPLYRGLRISHDELKDLFRINLVEQCKLMIELNLTLDVNGGPDMPAGVARLAAAVPKLRIVINHAANLRIDGKEPPRLWREGMEAAAKHPNVFCKVSGIVEQTGKTPAPRDVEYYRPVLDTLWKNFGEDRLIFGSNWPVSDNGAPFETVVGIVQDYFAAKGEVAAAKYFLGNAQTAYSIAVSPWQKQTIATDADFRGLCVVSPKVIWVSGTGGTYGRTIDGGKTWTVGTVPGSEKLDFRDVEAFGEKTAYLLSTGPGDASRIYKTVDGGKSWEMQFKSADPAAFFDAIAFWDEKNGIALGDPIKGLFQLLVTTDGGSHWKPLAARTLPPALAGEGAFAASGTCLVTHGDSDVWFATGSAKTARVFHSGDRGQNWEVSETPILAGAESAGIFSIAFRDKQHGMVVGGDYRKPNDSGATAATTADGGNTWTPLDNRLPFRSAVAWAKDRWVAVGTSGSHVSLDNGATWKQLDRENYSSVGLAANGDGWAVGPKGRIAKLVK